MLHAKFHGHWSTGSGEEVLKIFTIYGRGGHIGHVTWTAVFTKVLQTLQDIRSGKLTVFTRPGTSLPDQKKK